MGSFTVTLPDEVIGQIRDRVAAGDYASESDLVRDSLKAFVSGDVDLDAAQIADTRASCAEMAADPAMGIPGDVILDRVRRSARRAERP